jgi:manganese/iron transport system permease protein/iron/zinc/copper transport system permease protein
MHYLIDPLRQFSFMRHGVLAGTLAGALCGLVGVYVVLRRMSYIGHGLSHAILGGAVVAYVTGQNFYVWAGAWGFGSAMLINFLGRRRKIGADAAIGIVTTASFAVGILLISRGHHFTTNFEAALFGNILAVNTTELLVIGGVLVATVALVLLRYQQLLFVTFDPEVADAYGVSTRRYDLLFAVVLAAMIVSTMQALGVLLIAAATVIPAIVARLLTDSFRRMLVISSLVGAACGFAGMYVSYYVDAASGATIVLVAAGVFIVVFGLTAVLNRRRLTRVGSELRAETAEGAPAFDVH